MTTASRIDPCLWFDQQAEEAANYYVGIFSNSRIHGVSRYGDAFTFNEAVSFQVQCDSQEQIDFYWDRLGFQGDPAAQQCGWLKDRYGVSWQIVPRQLNVLMTSPDQARVDRVMSALLRMKKLEVDALVHAAG